jgi:hypothetical protein
MKMANTKRTSKITVFIAIALLSVAATLRAEQIGGSITFYGVVQLDNPFTVGTATRVIADGWHGIGGVGLPMVASSSGSFSTFAPMGSPVMFASPWNFASGPVASFWTVGGFVFDLTESHVFSQGGTPAGVVVNGTGTLSGNGFDPTPGFWSFSSADPSAVGLFSFSGASAAVPQPSPGCTFTIGYWKNHAGEPKKHGFDPDVVTPLLPIRLGTLGGPKTVTVTTAHQAVLLLQFSGQASNGINKLYAQLLGAKLNIASGANPSSIASTINAADIFLATHNSADWSGLTKGEQQTVLGWMSTLDNYNNGVIGPGHCEES